MPKLHVKARFRYKTGFQLLKREHTKQFKIYAISLHALINTKLPNLYGLYKRKQQLILEHKATRNRVIPPEKNKII